MEAISLSRFKMTRIENMDEATARIEAALYSAGRPLRIEDIIRASGTESKTKHLNYSIILMKKTKSAFKALEVVILPDGSYVFQLKPEYSATVKRYASKPVLPNATLKTLSYIAYHATNFIKTTCRNKRFRSLCSSKRTKTIRFYQSSKCWEIKNLFNN